MKQRQSLKKFLESFKNTDKKFTKMFIISILCFIFLFLFINSVFFNSGTRFIFFFPKTNSNLIGSEIRYFKTVGSKDEKLNLFLNELILGPISHKLVPLYDTKTNIEMSFMRNNALYVSFSSHIQELTTNFLNYSEIYELFKKNVCTNFRNIDKIYMYVDGIIVFEENL